MMAISKRTSNPLDRVALLANHYLFQNLPAAVIERIAAYMTRRTVARGRVIFRKDDPGSGLMGVISGMVRISVQSADGKEIVLNIIHPGEVFGEIALLDDKPRTATAAAVTDCELMVIDRRDFVAFLRGEPDVALKFIEILCERLRRTSRQLEEMAFLNLPSRLAKTLLQLADSGSPDGEVSITQRELGNIVGTSRESTNKQLRAWAARKWIRVERGRITILKPAAIAAIADSGPDGSFL